MNEMSNRIYFDKAREEPIAVLNRFTIRDLVKVLRELQEQTGKMPEGLTAGVIHVTPIVSAQNGMPRIELESPELDKPLQLDHAAAFELAHALLETTATAINEAMLFGFINSKLGIERERAAEMLFAFREYRGNMLAPKQGGDGEDSNG
jgi:hypothetical protein